jgi:hypothetical protein
LLLPSIPQLWDELSVIGRRSDAEPSELALVPAVIPPAPSVMALPEIWYEDAADPPSSIESALTLSPVTSLLLV